ncbi:hypothetical protein ACLVWQ_28845 [Streptomyces sp. CWNU-52B]|uniref:hypothetical protein n=1 Tax=unclassified Streptomyces TaxID=2593676 RepID=UPI0039C1D441
MSERISPIPESSLARSVFGPLGGVIEIGAVNRTGTWELSDVSVGDFLTRRQDDVAEMLDRIRTVCAFGDAAMGIVDELGRFRDHEVPAAFLLLWSGGLEAVPRDLAELDEPVRVRRMCRMAADLQLSHFLQALITAAIVAGTEAGRGAEQVAGILRLAAGLADESGRSAPTVIFRMWRVAHLPGILRPESDAPESGKAAFRAYDGALEHLLDR